MYESRSRVAQERGKRAEAYIAQKLETAGFQILARNFIVPGIGELDIVAEYRGVLRVIEVRARIPGSFGDGADSITSAKLRRIRRTTSVYLDRHHYMNKDIQLLAANVELDKQGTIKSIRWIPMN
jgi:putative endonuclease